MVEKIIVLGSNSFSGACFIDYLIEQGLQVMGISRSPEPPAVFLPYKRHARRAFSFHQLDLNHHLDQIIAVIRRFKPDYIVNFASQSMVAESWLHPEHWFQTNVLATIKFHDKIRRFDFYRKYVHISTPEVYGHCRGRVSESEVYDPSTPYAVSRAAADMSLMTFFKAYAFPVVFTRAANVYGPGQQLYRIIPRAILCFATQRKLMLHGGGHSVRSFIHAGDVADGTLKVCRKGVNGEVYHLAVDRTISIRALVKMIADQMGVAFETLVESSEDRLGKDAAYVLDSHKAREQLNWQDRIDLENGIAATIGWVRDNQYVLERLPLDYIHRP